VPARSATDEELDGGTRLKWAVESTAGMKSLGAGVVSAGWGVARDRPDEYGANWRGFGQRYVIRLSGVAIGNGMEAALGAWWAEDPRYQRLGAGSFWTRVRRAGTWTVLARRADGRMRPAYARFIGIAGNNFMTNGWRVDSDRSAADALSRSAVGVSSRYVSNAFDEFWPDIRRFVLRP
jgi:hypothetical protein